MYVAKWIMVQSVSDDVLAHICRTGKLVGIYNTLLVIPDHIVYGSAYLS